MIATKTEKGYVAHDIEYGEIVISDVEWGDITPTDTIECAIVEDAHGAYRVRIMQAWANNQRISVGDWDTEKWPDT
jgi:hypothetical protein